MSSEKVDRKNPDQRTTKKREEALIRDIARRLEAGEESSRPLAEVRAELSARPRTVYALVALTEEEAGTIHAVIVAATDTEEEIVAGDKVCSAIRTALARPVEPQWSCPGGMPHGEDAFIATGIAYYCIRGFHREKHKRVLVFPCEEETP